MDQVDVYDFFLDQNLEKGLEYTGDEFLDNDEIYWIPDRTCYPDEDIKEIAHHGIPKKADDYWIFIIDDRNFDQRFKKFMASPPNTWTKAKIQKERAIQKSKEALKKIEEEMRQVRYRVTKRHLDFGVVELHFEEELEI